MDPAAFWGEPGAPGAGPSSGLALQPAHSHQTSMVSQRSQRLPGPAGRLAPGERPAASGGGATSGGGGTASWATDQACEVRAVADPDFQSPQWLQALQEGGAPFDEGRDPFRGNTVRCAAGLQHNGVQERLLAVVASVRRCHSGEAFVRLKDPTGTIGGTLTAPVLENEPDVRQGAVLRLRRVTVLRMPPPRCFSHLCITLDSVLQVIPPPPKASQGPAAGATQQAQEQPRRIFPSLPAPPPAAAGPGRLPAASSWLSQPSQAPQQPPPHRQQQQQPARGFGAPAGQAPAHAGRQQGMPPPPARPPVPAPAPAPTSSLAWPSLGPQRQQQPANAAPQQQQQRQQSSSFAWPSLGGGAGAGWPGGNGAARLQPGHAQQAAVQQQQASPNASVNFSMPAISDLRQPWQQAACQDDASSGPASQAVRAGGDSRSPAAGGAPAAAGATWLQGLLAEAEYPFAGLGPSQASQQPGGAALPGRAPLASLQPPQQPQQEQRSPPGAQQAKRARQEPAPLLPVLGSAAFADADDLDLSD